MSDLHAITGYDIEEAVEKVISAYQHLVDRVRHSDTHDPAVREWREHTS